MTNATIDLTWDADAEALEAAAEYSDRARRCVQRLLALGVDAMDIDVYADQEQVMCGIYSYPAHQVRNGWLATGQRMGWGEGHKGGPKFRHAVWARECLIVAFHEGVEIAIALPQIRYGQNGKVRPQAIKVGAPIYQQGQLAGYSADAENPEAIAARKALGM